MPCRAVPCNSIEKVGLAMHIVTDYIQYSKFGGNISDRDLNYFLDEIKPSCG